jgi:Tol biopolymer transport system component
MVGGVDPAGSRISVSQVCEDPAKTGLWVVDLATGEGRQVVTANVGQAKWSPDGTWLVFGLYPLVGDRTSTVWAARADGHQLRQVTDRPSFTPVWLPVP